MVLLLKSLIKSWFALFQEGESNSEETAKKSTSRVPPLAESFVKETSSKTAEQNSQISKDEAVKENGDNEAITQNDSHSASEESNSENDSKHKTDSNANTNNKNSALENSQNNQTAKDRSGANKNTEHLTQTSKNANLHVKQNFGAIHVGLEYTGEDVKPLEENSEGEDNVSIDSESESESDSDDDEEQNRKVKGDEKTDDIRAAYAKSE